MRPSRRTSSQRRYSSTRRAPLGCAATLNVHALIANVSQRTYARALESNDEIRYSLESELNSSIISAEQRAHLMIESLSTYAIFSLSLDGRITTWNTGARNTFGYEDSEVIGESYAMIFMDVDVSRGLPESELVEATRVGISSVDCWHRRKDGTHFWSNDTIHSFRDGSGSIGGFTKVVQDCTERYESSLKLRESEERLRLLIEGVIDSAIFSLASDGTITYWNSGAENTFGYSEGEVMGQHFSFMYSEDSVINGEPNLELAHARTDGRAHVEGWLVRKNGERFYAESELTMLRSHDPGIPRGFVKIARDITAKMVADELVKRRAYHDELTQLPNRANLIDCLRRAMSHSRRDPKLQFAVMFLDLDRFKLVNDSFGHLIADSLLIHVARTLERCVRPHDVVSRIGGDEFVILFTDTSSTDAAMKIAMRIQASLQEAALVDGMEISTTASIGIAINSSDYSNPEQILRDADFAMYQAKAVGPAHVVIFERDLRERALEQRSLESDLRHAVERNELVAYYQPIVSLTTRRPIGFEALVRWNHPSRGFLMPNDFINEAERTGIITQIDRWVLFEACRQIRAWQLEFEDPSLTVSVNVSTRHFARDGLPAEVKRALDVHDLSPHSLKLEITETGLMESLENTTATISRIQSLGVELYLDDFGTGYSSLSYLARLPLKLLKVDSSFVNNIFENDRSAEVAHAIVSLAHTLGLQAVAEGIESEKQLDILRGFDCDWGQGYLFARPMLPEAVARLIGCVL